MKCKSCVWNVIDFDKDYKNYCKKGQALDEKYECEKYRSLDIKKLEECFDRKETYVTVECKIGD